MFIPSARQRAEVGRTAELAATILHELGRVPGPDRRRQARADLRWRCAGLGARMRRILSRDADARSFKPFGSRPLTHAELFVLAAQALGICENRQRDDRAAAAVPASEPAF